MGLPWLVRPARAVGHVGVGERAEDPRAVPLEPASAELERLRRAVYAPGTRADQAAEYRRMRAELQRDQADVGADRGPEGTSAASHEEAGHPVTAPSATTVGRSRRPLALAGAAGAVIGLAAGFLVAPAVGRTAAPASVTTAPPAERVSGDVSALSVFSEPQRAVDRPPTDVGARLLPASFRRLRSVPARGVDIYAAQDSAADLCLVAISVEARLAAACAPMTRFQRTPLRLAFRADGSRGQRRTSGTLVDMTATWEFIRGLTVEETPAVGQ